MKTNKAATAYAHPDKSYVVSMSHSPDGGSVCVGHLDGSVYTFAFSDGVAGKLTNHGCAPTSLSWGARGFICAGGADAKIAFYETHASANLARAPQVFDLGNARDSSAGKEVGALAFNPTGDVVVVGTYNKFYAFAFDASAMTRGWKERGSKLVECLYAVTALGWKPDGSRIGLGAVSGGVDLFDLCVRKSRHGDAFEFTHVSASNVLVKRLDGGATIVFASKHGHEIGKISVHRGRYLTARTDETLLCGDVETAKVSEVAWTSGGSRGGGGERERFDFETERACVVHHDGALFVIEYGVDEILGTCRASHRASHLLSVRVNEAKTREGGGGGVKKIAHLVDAQTIRVADLGGDAAADDMPMAGAARRGGSRARHGDAVTISHDAKVDWLELNQRATHLLFRDKKRALHLYDIGARRRHTLLNYCSYTQWVPGSDVIVAQCRQTLCVWYSVDSPDRVTNVPIKGEVEGIERGKGHTEVVVDEGASTTSYALDESLIEFNSLVEDGDYDAAVEALESLALTPETEAMWTELRAAATADKKLLVARRCAAALGDVSAAEFLGGVLKDAAAVAVDVANDATGLEHFRVKASLAMMQRRWKVAEALLVENGRVDDAISMYREMHRLDDAVLVAESSGRGGGGGGGAGAGGGASPEDVREERARWLEETGQEAEAAAVKERDGDDLGAIRLYLRGGLPGRAAGVVIARVDAKNGHGRNVTDNVFDEGTIRDVFAGLARGELHERAGELSEALGRTKDALASYVAANAFRRAVDLCARPGSGLDHEVPFLEEKWGDHLFESKQFEQGINHFLNAGQAHKAIECAIEARHWKKAAEMLEKATKRGGGDASRHEHQYLRLARHHESVDDVDDAERCFLRASAPGECVEMYARLDRWDRAHKIAVGYMTDADAKALYVKRGRELESNGRYAEAEKAYVAVNEHDTAIAMYEKHGQHAHVLRLVSQHRPETLRETRAHLATTMENDGNYRDAERQYVEAGDWKAAVAMYKTREKWEDAMRVAKAHGGEDASVAVSYAWTSAMPAEEAVKTLRKHGVAEAAVTHACDAAYDFDRAHELARALSSRALVSEVHMKHAMHHEDEGRFVEAEIAFVKADKPKEAIEMWIHAKDWKAAMKVAEEHDPASALDVQLAHAKVRLVPIRPRRRGERRSLRTLPGASLRPPLAFNPRPRRLSTPPDAFQLHQACVEENDFHRAEGLYVKARRPERAMKMYARRDLWEDALRVSADYLPNLVSELQAEMRRVKAGGARALSAMTEDDDDDARDAAAGIDSVPSSGDAAIGEGFSDAATDAATDANRRDGSVPECVARGKRLEREGNYAAAVDAFLEMTLKVTKDTNALADAWSTAVAIASDHVPGKHRAVVVEVAKRLRDVGRSREARDLCASSGVDPNAPPPSDSVARRSSSSASKNAADVDLREMGLSSPPGGGGAGARTIAATTSTLSPGGKASVAAAEDAARRGDWDAAHAAAAAVSPDVAATFSVKHATIELRGGSPAAAAEVLATHGVLHDKGCYALYEEIAAGVLAGARDGDADDGTPRLKAFLLTLVTGMEASFLHWSPYDRVRVVNAVS